MRSANRFSREQARRHRVTQSFQVLKDLAEESPIPGRAQSWHVLEKHNTGLDFTNDTGNVGPEVSVVGFPTPLPCCRMRLTWEATDDGIDSAFPRLAFKGAEVREHRSRIQLFFFHAANQLRDSEGFPFNEADCDRTWNCQLDAVVKSCSP